MFEYPLSASQVQAAAHCTFAEAQLGVYMASCAPSCTLAEFAEKTRLGVRATKDAAWSWGVRFSDYDPYGEIRRIEWRKRGKRDGWALLEAGEEVGECVSLGNGNYEASFGRELVETYANPRRAMVMVSLALDTRSNLPVRSLETDEYGLALEWFLGDADADTVCRLRSALDFRAQVKAAELEVVA